MSNIIRKASNTVAVKATSKNIITEFFDNYSLRYFQRKYYQGFYKEHYNAVKDVIHVFVNVGQNHVILHAPTQSGKTTVMTLLYNVVNESESFLALKRNLGIKKVIYLTGDNQFELSEQSMDRFRYQCQLPKTPIRLSGSNPCKKDEFILLEKEWLKSGKTPFIMVKNGDCKKLKDIKDFTLNNTLIMVDESHYGTKRIDSQVNQLLQTFGKDFSGDPKKLQKNKTYIMSVSATPYNEEFADKINNAEDLLKGIVHYKAGKGYIGFSTLYKNGMIEGLKDNSDVKDRTKFIKFLKSQREKMDIIYDATKKRHSVIMRMQGKKTLLQEIGKKELSKIATRYGFNLMIVDCKNTSKKNIDYENAYKEIRYSQFDGGKNVLIVVKQGFSYGISIPDDVKPLISTIYDFRPKTGETTTDGTEQGLLGRMTGYHPQGLSKYLKIYISNEHLEGLYGYHCEYPPTESPMPSKKSLGKVKCTYEEWNNTIYQTKDTGRKKYTENEVKMSHIVVWNNSKKEPLVFKGKVVDDFFAKHDDFDYDKLLSKKSVGGVGFVSKIARTFNSEILRFDMDTIIETRRQVSADDSVIGSMGYQTTLLSNLSRWGWRTVENAKKERKGWAFIIDISKANGKKGIEIRIPYGTIGFSKDVKVYKQRKNYEGYQKSELVLALAAQ